MRSLGRGGGIRGEVEEVRGERVSIIKCKMDLALTSSSAPRKTICCWTNRSSPTQ